MNYPTSPRRETSSVSKLTVEYLKKFGQNRDLQQYFVLSAPLTTSAEYLNANTQMETKVPMNILIETKKGPLWSDLNLSSTNRIDSCEYQRTPENNNINTGRLSSASSVISDKRLEWDSGADVGYVNYYNSKHKEKSLSLPVLSTIDSSADNSLSSSSRKSKKQTKFSESTPVKNTHKFFQKNEAEITPVSKECVTPLKAINNLQKDKSISLEDTRLKSESSPKKSSSQINLPNIEKSSVIENMYIFSPMFLKNLNHNKKQTSDKIMQTTLEKGPTKLSSNVTDMQLYETDQNNPSSFTKTSDDDKLLTFTKVISMPNTSFQIPTSSSFEYIPGNISENLENNESMSSPNDCGEYDLPPIIVDGYDLAKSCAYKINTNPNSNSSSMSTNQGSSEHSIGSILIGSQYSTNLTKDLEHTVSAIRNIIEAKEYTESDKKRLIRKIVKKIVNTNYDDDPEDMKNPTCWTPVSSTNVKSITSTYHSDNNISPGYFVSSSTVLTPFQISNGNTNATRHSNSLPVAQIDSVRSPQLLTPFKLCQKIDIHDDQSVNENEEEIKDLVGTEGKVSWKKDITFSEQLFAERIENLQIQQRHLYKDRKKKRNINTNVEQLHKKIVVESDGDTMSKKKLLKITEKEFENKLKWIKSEIFYLNKLRLLLEDKNQISIIAQQIYALFSSNSIKKTSSQSLSSSSSNGSVTQSESESCKLRQHKSYTIPRQAKSKQNDIDKIIEKNYILTESSLSKQKSTKSHLKNINTTKGKTDRDLQSKIISNIQDVQAKEFWKLNFNRNSTVNKQLKSNNYQVSSEISESTEPTRASFPESEYNLIKDSFSQTESMVSTSSRKTTENHDYEEKYRKQVLEISDNKSYSKKNVKSLTPTVAIQTQIIHGTRQKNNNQVSGYSSNCANKDKIGSKLVCSKKHKQSESKHYRKTSTQTSNQKINLSSSSEEYQQYRRSKFYKCKQKVDQETQTDHKSSSHTAQTKNQSTSLNLKTDTSSSSNASASINQQNCNIKHCTCNQNWVLKNINSLKSINQSNKPQQTSSSLYLNLKTTTDTSSSQRNSSFVPPETVHDSDTNSMEFTKNTQKVENNNKSFSKSHESNISKQVNYKTWPIYLESYHVLDKLVPNSDRVQHSNKNNICSKIQSKDSECMQRYNAGQEYLSPSDNNDKRDGFEKTKKCTLYKETDESLRSSSLDVRTAPSCYTSNNNNNTQLSESISRRFPNSKELPEELSKESHVFEDYASFPELSHHHYSRSISRRTSSSDVITIDPRMNMATRHELEDKVHSTSSVEGCCIQHHHNSTNLISKSNSKLNLHKRIQQMLNRCDICSKQRGNGAIQQTSTSTSKLQIKYCNECSCQYLDSNSKQQITNNDNNDVLCCTTCKLLQQQETNYRHHNSIAYFLRIESRDNLIILDENQQQTKSTTNKTIEEVKIYVPKFIKHDGSHIIRNINNHTNYVEEIGLDNNKKSIQSLQECLSKNKPEFINAADNRQQCLKEISKKRFHNTKRNNIGETNYNNITNNNRITPKKNKLFTSKNMKEITYRKYRTLAEVEQKKYNMILFRQRRRNRLRMQLFNTKLQQKVHKGELDFSLTKTLLK